MSSIVCCSGFWNPTYSYHFVNRKVRASKNKSFLCCSGPPLHNSGVCSCSMPWKTNSAVQLGSSRQQKGNFNPPLFFSFGTTEIYLVIKSGKAPHHLRRIGKWAGKLWQIPLTCRLGKTTGQEMNPPIGQSAWRAEESNYVTHDWDSGTAPISLSHLREQGRREKRAKYAALQNFCRSGVACRYSFIGMRCCSQRRTYMCLSSIPHSVVWKQTIQEPRLKPFPAVTLRRRNF